MYGSDHHITVILIGQWQFKLPANLNDQTFFCTPLAGVPSSPMEVTVTPQSPTVINVAWREPSVTNGVIVGYIVQYIQMESGNLAIIACGTHPSKLLVGLSPNTTYQVVVRARNEHGVSVASEVVMGMTPPISSELLQRHDHC